MLTKKYLSKLIDWQQEKETVLIAEDGWLSVVGLHWLSEGDQSIGSSNQCDILIPVKSCAEIIGKLSLNKNKVIFSTNDSVVLLNGKPSINDTVLFPDISGTPTIISSGDISFFIIVRGDMIGVRVKHNSNKRRKNFPGRKWFPANEEFIIKGEFQSFDKPRKINIPNILGQTMESEFLGKIIFDWNGETHSLIGQKLEDGSFYIIMNDASCKIYTYPAGRFLVTEKISDDNKIIIDFNKAYNPPCAFTNFATCPLPPRENILPFEILAGEQFSKEN
jgi:uncharacterized protein